MKFTSFSNIKEALAAGQRAEAKISTSPLVSPTTQSINNNFSAIDFASSSMLQAVTKEQEFIWTSDTWGSLKDKVVK